MRARMTTENSGVSETKQGRSYVPAFFAALGLLLVLFGIAFALDRTFKPGVWVEAPAQAVTQPSPQDDAVTANTAATASSAGSARPLQFAKTPLEREVETAYWRFLEVYSEAVLSLDPSRLPEVLDGEALQWVTDEVNDLKAQGRPLSIIEESRVLTFRQVTSSAATLEDRYTSWSVFADPQTKQPLPASGPGTRVFQTYEFRKKDGTWKIIGGARDEIGEVSR